MVGRDTAVVAVGLLLGGGFAGAQDIKNVKGFDTDLLAGKVCKGTFNTGGTADTSKGAVQVVFSVEDSSLIAHFKRKFGPQAYEKPFGSDAGFDDLGKVVQLSVNGTDIRFTNSIGVRYKLAFGESKLTGEADPTSNPRFSNSPIAKVTMTCG